MPHKIIYFCESYINVENALFLLERYKGDMMLVIIDNIELKKLFTEIITQKKINVDIIFVPLYHNTVKYNKIKSYLLINLFNEKKYIHKLYMKYFVGIKNSTIYFSTLFEAPYTYYILKNLTRDNDLIYFAAQNYPEDPPSSRRWLYSTRDIYNKLKLLIIYGNRISQMFFPDGRKWIYFDYQSVNPKHLISPEKRKDMVIPNKLYLDYNIWGLDLYKLIIFDTPFQRDGIVRSKAMENEMNEVFRIIKNYIGTDEVGIKLHPGENSLIDYKSFNYGQILPSYIMGQFFTYNKLKVIISFWSTLMFENNCEYNISLIKLVSFLTPELVETRYAWLKSRATKRIYFPETLAELNQLLNQIQNEEKNIINNTL